MPAQVTIRYFDGCPNWKVALDRVHEALEQVAATNTEVVFEKIESHEQAERVGFLGSPSVLIEGRDPFAYPDSQVGLSCRVFRTESGAEGAPSVRQLVKVLRGSADLNH
jgi:uracil DNA glycosylase